VIQLVAMGVAFGVLASLVALLVPWLPEPAGKEADRIDFVFWFTTWICIAIFALVASVLAYSILKFRVRPDDDSDGPPIHGHTGLEVVWTAIPAVLVTAISVVSAVALAENGKAGTNPLRVKVLAQQFAWTFDYGNGVTLGHLVLPEGRKTELQVTAVKTDVIHSFWVPQLRQKQDAVPGEVNNLVVTPTKLGTFPVICTELCGLGHALMRSTVTIMPAARFDQWLRRQRGPGGGAPAPGGGAAGGAAAGEAVFKNAQNGCTSCHTFQPAGSTGTIGPDLDKLAQYAQAAGKPLHEFVRQSIVDPDAYIQPGFQKGVMPPNFGQTLTPSQVDALVQYLTQGAK
jgi:cytochrome c oxidase subunit 2